MIRDETMGKGILSLITLFLFYGIGVEYASNKLSDKITKVSNEIQYLNNQVNNPDLASRLDYIKLDSLKESLNNLNNKLYWSWLYFLKD